MEILLITLVAIWGYGVVAVRSARWEYRRCQRKSSRSYEMDDAGVIAAGVGLVWPVSMPVLWIAEKLERET